MSEHESLSVAIVGMACRFPGAADLDAFWEVLRDGRETIRSFSEDELRKAGVDDADLSAPGYVKARAVLDGIELFDATYFGYTPKEAEIIDPQQRLFLEIAVHALEHAGCDPQRVEGRVGVYAGAGMNTYLFNNLASRSEVLKAAGGLSVVLGNDKDFLATRVAYKLDLRGPAVTVQTACSTSLVAVHTACQALLSGECDVALAGGVSVSTPQQQGYYYIEGGIDSPDGHCRAFDARAKGTVAGSGVGAVVLKRLGDAVAAGDRIYAVIKGSAVNNDGASKVGYTAPSVDGQRNAILAAQAMADVEPESISYVEAHGTGTPMGDPIEVRALTSAFRERCDRTGFCTIGSVKTNIGHADTAAGIAGLIKTVLALQHRQLPPSLNFEQPNPRLELGSSPFIVSTALTAWTGPLPLRAAVSSFGMGGTNAHVILEEAPPAPAATPATPGHDVAEPPDQLLVLSARSPAALAAANAGLASWLADRPEASLASVASTLQTGRKQHAHRQAIAARSVQDARAALLDPKRVVGGIHDGSARHPVFMFSGQGSQYADMGRELYDTWPVFRREVDRCAELLAPRLGHDLRASIFSREGESAKALIDTAAVQPALFTVEYAMARLLMTLGLDPVATIGHSIGEYVSACLSGVFSLDDALALVAERGRLMQLMPAGAMAAVGLAESALQSRLVPGVAIAAVNGPELCVVSGPTSAVQALERTLTADQVMVRRLHASHAFHSPMMLPIVEPFRRAVAAVSRRPPTRPFLSSLTGTWIRPDEATSPDYWARHVLEAVRFADAVAMLLGDESFIPIEVGPGSSLAQLAAQQPLARGRPIIATMPHARETRGGAAVLLGAVGKAWVSGLSIDFPALAVKPVPPVVLPPYPFQRQRFWIEPGAPESRLPDAGAELRRRSDVATWFYLPAWRRTLALSTGVRTTKRWLVFGIPTSLGARLAEHLRAVGNDVVFVEPGTAFTGSGGHFAIRPGYADDYEALFCQLGVDEWSPERILHAWSVDPDDRLLGGRALLDRCEPLGFYSLLFLSKALAKSASKERRTITVLVEEAHDVTGSDPIRPEKATILGPVRVIPREHPTLACRAIDVRATEAGTVEDRRLIAQLAQTLSQEGEGDTTATETLVAFRGVGRWVQAFEPSPVPTASASMPVPRTCLITGGLGGIGSEIARHLATSGCARIALVGRSELPPRDQWTSLIETGDDETCSRIEAVEALEALGTEVLVCRADVADEAQMSAALAEIRARFGSIDWLVHAAGLPGSSLMQTKTVDEAKSVLAPKVLGTLLLERLFRDEPPQLMVLCSSLNAVFGEPGTSDYSAANAYLDAFAAAHSRPERPIVAIGWDAWREVGMAAKAVASMGRPAVKAAMTDYFRASPETMFLLDEHRIMGVPTLPGTAYLQLALRAVERREAVGAMALSRITLMAPLSVADGHEARVRTSLTEEQEGYAFTIASRIKRGAWQVHATGKIARIDRTTWGRHDVGALFARCAERPITRFGPDASTDIVAYGPRWMDSFRGGGLGEREAVARIELPARYEDDLAACTLHPAVLDVAAGFVVPSLATEGCVPFSYGKVTLRGPLPQTVVSHVRWDERRWAANTLSFQVTLMSEAGDELAVIEDYTFMVLREQSTESATGRKQELAANPLLRRLALGMSSAEGAEVFDRVTGWRPSPHLIVSTVELAAVIAENRKSLLSSSADGATPSAAHPRPDLGTEYVGPRGPLEKAMADIWQTVIGVKPIGVFDDFFELGGHSLLALQLLTRVRDVFQTELPMQVVFEAPTVAGLAEQLIANETQAGQTQQIAAALESVDDIGDAENVARVLTERGVTVTRQGGVTLRAPDEPLVLSYGQLRLWVLDQLLPGTPYYNMPGTLRLRGSLDGAAFQRALQTIVDRHEVLRTTFTLAAGEPIQVIVPRLAFELPLIDLTDLPEAERERTAMAAAAGEAARPFDLVQGPLIRAVLLRLSPEDHLVALTLHHIVSDGWSMAIIIRELAAIYNAFVSGSESPLPPLPVQYADYAIYQRSWLDSGVMTKQLAYWTEHFAEMPPSLEMPLDRARPSTQSFKADRVELFIDRRLTEPLRALAQREGATLFMVLLAAFKILLHRYSGETDICVGTPIANRKWAETEGLIGFFLNTLVLRTDLSGDPTFHELVGRVRQTTLDGYANQDVPFERLLQVVQPHRDLSRTPLFQTFFNMLNFPLSTITLSELSVHPDFDPVGSKFDMTPYIREMDDGIQFDMVFNADLFDRARMVELLEQTRLVLAQAAADAEVKLSAIDLASVAHRERVAARRAATVGQAVSEVRASSGNLAGVGELCEIVVDGVPSGRLGRYSPEGKVVPLVTRDASITSPRRLRRRMPRAVVDAVTVMAEARGRPAHVGWTAAVAALFAKVEDATRLCIRRPDDHGRDQDPSQPVKFVLVEVEGDPSFGALIDVVGKRLESAARAIEAAEGSRSELEEQSRRGRVPVIEWLDGTVDASDDATPLRLRFLAVGDELEVQLDWQEGACTSQRAACLVDQLAHLAAQLAIDGDGRISAADLVPAAHRPKLPDLGQVLPTVPLESVPQMVARAADVHPLRPAIEHGTRSWSYGRLDEVVRRIAGALHAAGVRRGDAIAVTGTRSFALVASMAAVLRAGGVLLCLDQNLPAGRRALMLREAKVSAILVIGDADVPAFTDGPVLAIDHEGTPSLAADPLSASDFPPGDAAAYIFFTSGTTGVPKGVLGGHAGLSHFIAWQRATFDVGPGDRAAQLTGLSFDVVLRDVFMPLASGATLVIPDSGDFLPDRLIEWLRRSRITLMHTVPSLAASWIADGEVSPVETLRCTFFAGEPLTDGLVRRWRVNVAPGSDIVNLYGPTETTLAKCFYLLPTDPEPGVQAIGSPLPQCQALVLDPQGRPCGLGQPGEIHIRTPYRTLGYLNLAAENDSRFWVNPKRDDPDDRIYRTGDRGRYRYDGVLEILGRLDDQIKIRGIRIEPVEIQAVIARHPAVDEAVVLASASGEEKRLVAYVVVGAEHVLSAFDLRAFLRETLPEVMIPSAFVFLDILPLNPNGKVDRRQLPAPTFDTEDETADEPAGTEMERVIAAIWCEVLQRDRVPLEGNFFDLGGDSLLMVQGFAKLREKVPVKLEVIDLFRYPTVRALARYVDTRTAAGLGESVDAAGKGERRADIDQRRQHRAAVRRAANRGPNDTEE
jgi:phthiocerol/phenolphthiocerol synthesis type-I polyketide synthase E